MMSDMSGNSLVSMGTEGLYTGPNLAVNPEQDLTGFENPESVIQQHSVKPKIPLAPRPPTHARPNIPTGPINPIAMSSTSTEESKQISADLEDAQARIAVLQRENEAVAKEKHQMKVQLNEQVAQSKKERERLVEHIKQQAEHL
jgi:hypothetical protein